MVEQVGEIVGVFEAHSNLQIAIDDRRISGPDVEDRLAVPFLADAVWNRHAVSMRRSRHSDNRK